jgi:hypothetical protein
MRSLVLLLAGLLASAGLIYGEIKTPDNGPIEITSTGQTTYENGMATARDNVVIHIGNTDIYADYAQYNSSTHDVELRGHVRIYRDASLYNADSGIYNTETKKIRAITARTESHPYFLGGHDVTSIEGSENAYLIQGGVFTTHDSSKPDFHLRAGKIRVYEDDRVIFLNVTAYIGKVPIFWWPYLYQSLDNAFSFSVSPRITAPGDHRFSRRSRSRSQTIFKPGSGWIISAGADRPSASSRQLNTAKTKAVWHGQKLFTSTTKTPRSIKRTYRERVFRNRDTGSASKTGRTLPTPSTASPTSPS